MDMVKRLLAVFLVAIAFVVAAHFMVSPLYEDAVDVGQVWDVINWFMAVGVVAALIVHYLRKRALDRRGPDGSIDRAYVEVNLSLYASIVLVLWFFWNWFDNLATGAESQGQTHLFFWTFVDPLFVLIAGTTGCCLWRSASRQ